MAYIAPIHRPNSVRHALRARLFPGEEDCLILAKVNRLEFWKLDGDSGLLNLADTKIINGTITMLQKMKPKDNDADLLFVGTDRFQYFTVLWDAEKQALDTVDSFTDIYQKHMRDSQSQDRCVTDPTGRFMVVLLWEGVLNVLRMKTIKSKRHNIEWMDQIRISELYIKSAIFLHAETGHPKLAFLYQTNTENPDAHLVIYRLYADDKHTEVSRFETKDQLEHREIMDPGAGILIPVGKGEEDQKRYIYRDRSQVRAQLGGLIVVGETKLLYYDDAAKKTVEAALQEPSLFVTWAEYDVSHYFIGDDFGSLWLLEILLDGAMVTGLEMTRIGVTARAHTLINMGNNLLFVGSAYGNSQLWRVDLAAGAPTLVQEFPNITPILDFNIMDMGNREGEDHITNEYSSGQARIVTGSGAWKDGSLRSVRSGVGLEDIGILAEMENVRAVFPIRSDSASKHDALLISFLTETRIFLFDIRGDVEEVEVFKGLILDDQTLLVRNLPNNRLLQITPTGVHLIDIEDGVVVSNWTPANGQSITNASANDSWVVLSVNGKNLISVQIQQDLVQAEQIELGDKDQVACIHLPPQFPAVCVVGFWKSGSISIFNVRSLSTPLHGAALRRKDDNTSIPRDIVMAQVLPPEKAGPTLFVAMEDGFVITFNVSGADFSLSGRKSVVLGTRHARLHLLPQAHGIYNVFATSEHPSLIYAAQGRIVYSAVTAEDATCVCLFDSEAFPDSLVVATENSVKISAIDTERRTHVRTLPMGQTVRRLAYSKAERVFGLGCISRKVVDNTEIIESSFKLVDDIIFDQVGGEVKLNGNPAGTEMLECVLRAELKDSHGDNVERFIVGTSFSFEEPRLLPQNDICGRILVIGIDSHRDPYLIMERSLKGNCRCLEVMGDYIVAALSKTVVVYRYNETSSTAATFHRVASYRLATIPTALAIEGNIIAVTDLMKSMSLVQFTPAADGEPAKLEEIGRHHQSASATAVGHIGGSSWLEADNLGNLMVLERHETGVTAEDKKRMRVTSEINLGEMVNKIRKVTVDPSENAVVIPQAFLGTVDGGIYLFGTIAPNHQDLLIRFQAKLAQSQVVETLGGLEFDRYRSFRNEEREGESAFRFIDGELLEKFLDVDEQLQEELCVGLGPDVETMRNLVEELKRLH